MILGSLSKPRRRRQREPHQTKGLMSKTIAVHVHYKSLSGAHHQERATPILSLCHGIFTDRSIFRHLFPQNCPVPVYMSAHR